MLAGAVVDVAGGTWVGDVCAEGSGREGKAGNDAENGNDLHGDTPWITTTPALSNIAAKVKAEKVEAGKGQGGEIMLPRRRMLVIAPNDLAAIRVRAVSNGSDSTSM